MDYRYKRTQLLKKRLNVPFQVRTRIYKNEATIDDFNQYDLADKIPIECLESRYQKITELVGIEKALELDWECILNLGHNTSFNWLKNQNFENLTAEEINHLLYKAIKEDYIQMLEKDKDRGELINHVIKLDTKSLRDEYHFEILGEKFSKAVPELLYTTDSYIARKILLHKLTLPDYIEEYDKYKIIPKEFVLSFFCDDTNKKLFSFLSSYIMNESNFLAEKLLLEIVFNSRSHYNYEKYLEIIEKNPSISSHDFLESAYLQRVEDQYWLKPSANYISKYNEGKEKKFAFGEDIDYDILSLIDEMPEYRIIFSQFLDNSLSLDLDIKDYDTVEDFIADLIIRHHLYYDKTLPKNFQNLYPDFFVQGDYDLKERFYRKKLSPEYLQQNPKYIEDLKDKNIGMGFQDKEMVEFIRNVGNDVFLDFCLKYGEFLYPVKKKSESETYEELIDQVNIERIKNHMGTWKKLENVKSIVDKIPAYFLDKRFPKELRDLFYKRELKPKDFYEHSDWCLLLKEKEISAGLKPLFVLFYEGVGKDTFLSLCKNYGKYFDLSYADIDCLRYSSKEQMIDLMEEKVFQCLTKTRTPYDDKIPVSFKEKYPYLFLPEEVDQYYQEKFYQREFSPIDLENDKRYFSCFEKLDIACYLKEEYSWLIGKINGFHLNNENKLKLASFYEKINSEELQNIFKEYILNHIETIDFDKIKTIVDLLMDLSFSNSSEMIRCRENLAVQLIKLENPMQKLHKIEQIFLMNHLPIVGKRFSIFKILHPSFAEFDFSSSSRIAPLLKRKSDKGKNAIIFADLVKASLGSNNRSLKKYIENLEEGNRLLLAIHAKEISVFELDEKDRQILVTFIANLCTLYNNTFSPKQSVFPSENIEEDLQKVCQLFSSDGKIETNLPDKLIHMFFHFAQFDCLNQVKTYMKEKILFADYKSRQYANASIKLEEGDFLKGIGDIKYLKNILQNGSLAVEFLGASAGSDSTPLDTDFSRIEKVKDSLNETISNTISSSYGPIWFVLKNDDRLLITRENNQEKEETIDSHKLEIFNIGNDIHYGVRTGLASSEIDYFISQNNDNRIGLEIAMNGFYIPVIDMKGNLIFTPQDYDRLREKMSGLSYYELNEFHFADSLAFDGMEELIASFPRNKRETEEKKKQIEQIISRTLEHFNLKLKHVIDGDLTEGSVELIDTGSTGRGTNQLGAGDFDFLMRIDKKLMMDSKKMEELKNALLASFHKENVNALKKEITSEGDFRLKNVIVDGVLDPLEIDITFMTKTDEIDYSTDMALKDKLNSIYKQSEEKYASVIANILLAKKILKEANAYKPNRGDHPEGGLGGVGIENWVLQNGGSFLEAVQEFLVASEGKNFEEFKNSYSIWDFGQNFIADKKGKYLHDDFVQNNMSEEGYEKMKKALEEYKDSLERETSRTL